MSVPSMRLSSFAAMPASHWVVIPAPDSSVIPAEAKRRAGIVRDRVPLLRHAIPDRACGASGMTSNGMDAAGMTDWGRPPA